MSSGCRTALPGSTLRILTSAGGLVGGRAFLRQGQHSFRTGGRRRWVFARGAGGRVLAGDRVRHGRHEHRRVAVRWAIRTGIRNAKGGRAARRADDGDRNGRGRRRIDLPVRRREACRRAGERGGRSGAGVLRARRAADGDRCEFVSWGGLWRSGFRFRWIAAATERRLERQLAAEAASPSAKRHYSLEELAAGLLRIANANMAAAIRSVTVAKGADPADYVLVAFGGAAPQHACAVARELGIRAGAQSSGGGRAECAGNRAGRCDAASVVWHRAAAR